ncbi:MFS transporter [Microbispora corallina]|uniref:MFS transporter n=1 Tax=Microbispora corallina TaxID=83302 RepID=A0ABQ4G775_9ACTN|nr:MFS transporter [Microbispora corallina]GIH42843.1 MFS transporter [Microbispora corallina]
MRARTSARLGADFSKLWIASAISNVGDGVTMAAGPLLVASLTGDPAQVAGAAFAQQLPWLLFALFSGVYVDRLDRRRLIVAVNLLRAVPLGVLALAIASGTAGVWLVYAAFFLLGVGETLADTAYGALLPAVVPPDRLAAANARLMATFTLANQFAAKPLGAWLFVVAPALPFAVDALSFVAAAALVVAVRPAPPQPPDPSGDKPRADGVAAEIAAGLRTLWHDGLLRALALSMGVANIAFCAAFSVFVLYARQRLGLSDIGYGLLLTTFGVGGLAGTGIAARLQARFGAAALLRAGLLLEAATHAILALTTAPFVAAAILVVFGVHTMVWGIVATTACQRAVPDRLRGRVGSVYSLLQVGGAAVGSLVGGSVARSLTVVAPFGAAAAVTLVIAVVAWRPLGRASAVPGGGGA